jgi:hypothetical protein
MKGKEKDEEHLEWKGTVIPDCPDVDGPNAQSGRFKPEMNFQVSGRSQP